MSRNFGTQVPSCISGGTGPWFVQLWGIPSRWTWQDLKDQVRPAASHVGHVAIYPEGRATITLRKWDEALGCFNIFSTSTYNRKAVYVELWETTPNQAPRLIWKNLERLPLEAGRSGTGVAPYALQLSPPRMPPAQEVLVQHVAQLQLAGQQVAPAAQLPYQHYVVSQAQNNVQQAAAGASAYPIVPQQMQVPRVAPSYSVNGVSSASYAAPYAVPSARLPTNPDRGTVRTEYRGVFVSNLSFDTTTALINSIFGKFGEIVKIEHKTEFKTNSKGKTVQRSKGNAVVTYSTSEQAESAIEELNGKTLNDRELNVRFDTEATPVNVPASQVTNGLHTRRRQRTNDDGTPLIVDGSKYGNGR